MDIRSYFSPKSVKVAPPKETKKSEDKQSKRKRIQRIDSSDDEDVGKETTQIVSKRITPKKKSSPKKKDVKSHLNPVNVDDFFGSKSSQNSESSNKKSSDNDLDAVLRDMDDDFDLESTNPPSKKIKLNSPKKISHQDSPSNKTKKSSSSKSNKEDSMNGKSSISKKLGSKKRSYEIEVETPTKIKNTPKKSIDSEDDEIPGTPQADYEEMKKKHQNAYKQFLSRGGARNPGCKDIPEAVSGCFDKMVFVLTGVYDSLEREEMGEIIKKCGGKTTTSLSRNTTYIVVGDQPGEAKLKKAETLGTKQLNEDTFLDLLREKSKSHAKNVDVEIKAVKKPPRKSNIDDKKMNLLKKENGKDCSIHETNKKREETKFLSKIHSTDTSPSETNEKISTPKTETLLKKENSIIKNEPMDTFSPKEPCESLLWVDKYKPMNLKNIIGQQGDRSNMRKLLEWLRNWSKYNENGPNKQKPPPRPSPWATAGDNGGWAKCALLSGPPGVGKTTTASLVCKELGFDIMELNASDGRSKKSLDTNVKEALSSRSLSKISAKRVLLMDEVDGMAGNEDRGGIAALILLLKSSKIPVICMCNDRNHEKIRSLANHCFDLRFQRPRLEQIKASMMSICFKEKIKVSPDAMAELITGCNNDVRQVLHNLTMLKARSNSNSKALTKTEAEKEASTSKKTSIKMGPWDVCKKVFSSQEQKSMSLYDKSDLFFYDFSIGPLFIQENYLSVTPDAANKDRKKTMELISLSSDSLCNGDLVEKTIRSKNAWNLLPVNAIYSSVLPGEYMSGTLHGQIQFPSWLGKNSRQKKMNRILQELTTHSRLRIGGSKESMCSDYAQHLENSVTGPLRKNGAQGIPASIKVMEAYSLQREDLDSLIEYTSWPDKEDPMKSVESKVKSAFTRTYNKEVSNLPYAISQTNTKKKTNISFDSLSTEDIEDEGESENEEDITSDAMIKAKTRKSTSSKNDDKKTSAKSKKSSAKAKKK
ncbi:replication factor C subunit 1 [Lepeophtheirus salmonis]|uniref:replication factor C subunit 1 n=1 Tax=Lepeophtheirus salmonis TaxID=72036 RepID=UPI001AE1A81D|nr:replication factor C subunit 1-like [Lepeophtheirus salmonis]